MSSFRAFRIFNVGGGVQGRLVEITLDDLDAGELVVEAAYSSVNYKDALAATGAGKVVRRFPCVGGIDVAGTVVSSSDERFRAGDSVLCTGYELGVSHDGGYSQLVRLPADWVVPLPEGLSLHESMALGTAGYTAALAIHLLELNDLAPERGRVVVNGASGGVGSLGIDMLGGRGYTVVAITGKESEQEWLKQIGASDVILRSALEMGTRPLEKAQWAGALDTLGGAHLGWLTRTMQQNGVIGSIGNAAGAELQTTVYPFILRGVRLIGVDSGFTDMPLRRRIWERLADDLRPRHLERTTRTVTFDQLPAVFEELIQGKHRGRTVVRLR